MGGGTPQFRQIFLGQRKGILWSINTICSPSWFIFSLFGPFTAPFLRLFDAKTPILAQAGKILLETWSQSGGFLVGLPNPLAPGSDIQMHVSWGLVHIGEKSKLACEL